MNNRILHTLDNPTGLAGKVAGLILSLNSRNAAERVIDSLDMRPGASVMEIGAGAGQALSRLLRSNPTARVTAVDRSPEMIAKARKRIHGEFPDANVYWLAEPIESALIQPYDYDCMYSINTVPFWTGSSIVLPKLYKGLRPGGRLHLALHSRLLNDETVIRLLERTFIQVREAGFDDIHSEEFTVDSSLMFIVTATRA